MLISSEGSWFVDAITLVVVVVSVKERTGKFPVGMPYPRHPRKHDDGVLTPQTE